MGWVYVGASREPHSRWLAHGGMLTKDDRRSRFNRRKARHARDILRKDYIMNERDEVTIGVARGRRMPKRYNIAKAKNIAPITNGGGHVAGNPRYADERQRHSVRSLETAE